MYFHQGCFHQNVASSSMWYFFCVTYASVSFQNFHFNMPVKMSKITYLIKNNVKTYQVVFPFSFVAAEEKQFWDKFNFLPPHYFQSDKEIQNLLVSKCMHTERGKQK